MYNLRSQEHHNIVFGDTLRVLENINLYSFSNYFL